MIFRNVATHWLSASELDLSVRSVRTAIRFDSYMLDLLTIELRYTVIITKIIQSRFALTGIGGSSDWRY